ncbi:hypothetical protein Ddc_07259 [Ditylenchus destructor]|nr:hypothetical protein Ddc_07259 [Ditylenchus destructor]
MLNITRSKLSKLLPCIRKRRNPITLPQDILIDILHYFPRKQLVKQFCLVNSTFLHVSNRLLPNLHVITKNNIRYLPFPAPRNPYSNKLNPQSFQAVVLRKDSQIRWKRINANKLFKNLPPWYVRFPSFEISGIPDDALLQFLQQTKQNFINCELTFSQSGRMIDNEVVQRARVLLTDSILDAREILFKTFPRIEIKFDGPEPFFDTCGVRNCDKVTVWCRRDRQVIESFKDWLEWKQDEPGSKRHLVLYLCSHTLKILEVLTKAFEVATKPLHYVVTFVECRNWEQEFSEDKVILHDLHLDKQPDYLDYYYRDYLEEFHLDNESTGERLSLFHKDRRHGGRAWRLWRRCVTPDDSIWLSVLSEMKDEFSDLHSDTSNKIIPEGFDEQFYDFVYPRFE